MTLGKLLQHEFLTTIQPKLSQLGFFQSTFQKSYFGTDEQGGYQYDFMPIEGYRLEMLYANIPSRTRGFILRYQQFKLPAGITNAGQLGQFHAEVVYHPELMRDTLFYAGLELVADADSVTLCDFAHFSCGFEKRKGRGAA